MQGSPLGRGNCTYASFDPSSKALTWNIADCHTVYKYNYCAKEITSCPSPGTTGPGSYMVYLSYNQRHIIYLHISHLLTTLTIIFRLTNEL